MTSRYVLVLLLPLAVACAEPQGAAYFPKLHRGAQLEYNIEYITPLGGVQRGTMVSRTEGDTTIDGRGYERTVTVISGIPGMSPQFIGYTRRTREGLYEIDTTAAPGTEVLVTPFPVVVGSTWSARVGASLTNSRVEAIERMALVSRTYDDCLKVSSTQISNGVTSTGTSWYARGVGLLKYVGESRGLRMQLTLAEPTH